MSRTVMPCACRKPCPCHATRWYSLIRQPVRVCLPDVPRSKIGPASRPAVLRDVRRQAAGSLIRPPRTSGGSARGDPVRERRHDAGPRRRGRAAQHPGQAGAPPPRGVLRRARATDGRRARASGATASACRAAFSRGTPVRTYAPSSPRARPSRAVPGEATTTRKMRPSSVAGAVRAATQSASYGRRVRAAAAAVWRVACGGDGGPIDRGAVSARAGCGRCNGRCARPGRAASAAGRGSGPARGRGG